VFHSFRHTLKDALRDANIDKETQDLIMEHSIEGVAGEYGRRQLMEPQRKAIALVKYPRLDLSHLHGRGRSVLKSPHADGF
jgi:hypothetical protein